MPQQDRLPPFHGHWGVGQNRTRVIDSKVLNQTHWYQNPSPNRIPIRGKDSGVKPTPGNSTR